MLQKGKIIALVVFFLIFGVYHLWNKNNRLQGRYERLQSELTYYRVETIRLQGELRETQVINSQYIRKMDSLNKLISKNEDFIEQLKKEKNEKIKNVSNWSANDRQSWFDDLYPRSGN